jgi:preprotein translocase subunit YajC
LAQHTLTSNVSLPNPQRGDAIFQANLLSLSQASRLSCAAAPGHPPSILRLFSGGNSARSPTPTRRFGSAGATILNLENSVFISNAYAQTATAGGLDSIIGLLPIILMFVILYFLMIRPQMKRQKEHRALVEALSKGDEIVTSGGIVGKVTAVKDQYVSIEVSETEGKSVEMLLQKVAVQTVLPKGTIKAL